MTTPLPDDARILVVRLSALGDCVHAVPLVTAIRRLIPGAEIDWAIQAGGLELLRQHPEVHAFHEYPRRGGWGWPLRMRRFVRGLRRRRYHVAVDVQGLLKSGLVARLSGAPLRIGFGGSASREGNRFFVNRRVEPRGVHVVDRNLELLHALRDVVKKPAGWEPDVEWVMPEYEATEALERFLAGAAPQGGYVVLNPGTTWPTKHWPAASFGELAHELHERTRLPIVLSWGTAAERALCEEVRRVAPAACHTAPATSLRELATLLGRARLVVANDTGPIHIAVAQGVHTVGIHGATSGARSGPYGRDQRVVELEPRLDCQPCHSKTCARRDLACLRQLEPETVLRACLEQLGP